MATSYLKPLHTGKGRTTSTAIAKIIDYVENPEKTDNGRLITGYECDTRVADTEFMLSKRQYTALTGRERGSDDVIAYHTRQAFMPGEVTPEQANAIGYELAMRFAKGKHAFIVCTHVDRHHIHNHIIFNSTTLDCTHKFRNFFGSSWALRRINDKLCLEHGLSIIENPKPSKKRQYNEWLTGEKRVPFNYQIRDAIDAAMEKKPADFDEFLRMLEAEGIEVERRGKTLRFRAPGQKRYTRCDTLRGDYTEQAIHERIAGDRVVEPRRRRDAYKQPSDRQPTYTQPPGSINMLIDIQAALKTGKGPGYERWAKVFNLKQLAQAVNYLKENGGLNYTALEKKAADATDRFNELSESIKRYEADLNDNATLQKHIVNYSKTRNTYIDYRKAGYSKKYRAAHEADILIHQAAKKAFDEMGFGKDKRVPTVAVLRKEYAEVLTTKRKAYAAFKQARDDMREAQNAKANVEYLLGFVAGEREQYEKGRPRA